MIRLLCAVLALCSVAANTQAEPFPLDQVFAEQIFFLPKISPDGRHLAALLQRDEKQVLVQLELPGFAQQPLAYMDEAKLLNFWWKGNDFMLVIVGNTDGSSDFRSYDLRTKKANKLAHLRGHSGALVHPLPDDPNYVLLSVKKGKGVDLCRLNIRTGEITVVERNPDHAIAWIVNHAGDTVAAVGRQNDKDYLLWRPSRGAAWERRELGADTHPDLRIAAIHPDQRRLIAWDYSPTGPATVVALDPQTMAKEILFSSAEVEANRLVNWNSDPTHPRAIESEIDKPEQRYFSAKDQAVQAAVDASLPDTANRIDSTSADEKVMVIHAWSDRDRGTYYLLDLDKKSLLLLARVFQGGAVGDFRSSQYLRFKARDGFEFNGRLTLPAPAANKPPLVVITSYDFAGPRVAFGFHAMTQMLATRGYAVVRFNYRGVTGFGRAFRKAGDFQIAQGMPDDIEDGVQRLVREGLVADGRVAIFGNYSGGIVAMEALARGHSFSAWINWNTPSYAENLDYMVAGWFFPYELADAADEWGDKKAAAKYRASIDPKLLIARIRIPSFHFYNRYSNGTLIYGGSTMEDWLHDHGASFTFVRQKQYRDHTKVQNEYAEILGQLTAFLDANLPDPAIRTAK